MLRHWPLALLLAATIGSLLPVPRVAAADPPKEEDFYKILTFKIPDEVVLEGGGLEMMSDGKLAISSRRGDIYMVEHPFAENPAEEAKFTLFAGGLHEVLGLAERNGWLYATQRCELTRLKDEDGDGRADLFETVSDGWEINGDYHEYAFGSPFDKDGNLWVVLCLTGSSNSNNKYRGWCLRINEDGKVTPTCAGIRSPGGIGMNAEGEMFYTDNQGPWNGTCGLKHLVPGSFQGHPAGLRWWNDEVAKVMGPKPAEPKSGSRFHVEAERIPEYIPPAILLPYNKMGKSTSGIACDTTGGKFGPFEKQLFISDQSASTVMRADLEIVNGRYQGALFPFRSGFSSGNLAMMMTKDGSLFVTGTNRGWGSRGSKPFALERMVWTGKTPFEVHTMRARPDGFELTFTEAVDPETAGQVSSYELTTYTYIFQSAYGSPEVDHTKPTIAKAVVSPDKMSVRLYVEGLQKGHVHELHMPGVRNAAGNPVLHQEAYYTLNNIPEK